MNLSNLPFSGSPWNKIFDIFVRINKKNTKKKNIYILKWRETQKTIEGNDSFHGQKFTPNYFWLSLRTLISPKLSIFYPTIPYFIQRGTRYCLAWRQYWCKPYLHQSLLICFLTYIFLFDANERICFSFLEFSPFIKTLKGRRPNLCQLVAYAGPL